MDAFGRRACGGVENLDKKEVCIYVGAVRLDGIDFDGK